ncbi:glycosyltransferase [Caldicellulosiruptor danielii]|uniref:Glycosyltransferase n=1 Tax=Anaerocellum danielii TaxID=1387557 RepID=A0ABZ0TZ73_9FIRM|nr:glycosyltransferase [Caldicellulosiruptor danielii]WPX08162.1 glycosyltransferase [Caldicellulosiruptor danielii]
MRALSLKPIPDFIGFTDADLSVSPDQWGKLIEKLDKYDVVVGSRSMPDSVVQRSVFRNLISKTFSKIVYEILQLGVRDTQCGLKFFRTDIAKLLFAEPLVANRYAFDIEILLRAKQLDLKIAEVGVNWVAKNGSKVTLSTPVEMLITLLKIVNAYNGSKPLQYQYNKKTLI